MRTLKKILLIWGGALVLLGAGAIAYPPTGGDSFSDFLLSATSSLLSIVSCFISRGEKRKGTKLAFLNFALLYGVTGVAHPLYQLAKRGYLMSSVWSDLYYFEYEWMLYFLLLSFSVAYLIVDHIVVARSTYAKYFASLAVVVSIWATVFSPFLLDAHYVYHTIDVHNFVAVRDVVDGLHKKGNPNPTVEEIASSAQVALPTDAYIEDGSSAIHKQRYVAELLSYVPGDNYRMFLFKPLYMCCLEISFLSVFSILFYFAYQYLLDSPRGAYLEKIVWCLLPYCCFEALHAFAFTRVTTVDLRDRIADVGGYLSMAVMWIMLFLFSLRLRFIQTVEGIYYERRVITDPSRITRWRDALDNWLLKEFMNPHALDRRFLTRRRTEE